MNDIYVYFFLYNTISETMIRNVALQQSSDEN